MNMRSLAALNCKRFSGLFALTMLHLLVLATLTNMPSPNSVQLISRDKPLIVSLLPVENPAVLALKVVEKRPRASALLGHSSKIPTAFQSRIPALESTSPSAAEDKSREEASALKEDTAKTTEPAGYSNNDGLHRDSMGSELNIGAVDQRWLPREMGALQQGSARPNLHARTPQEGLERTLSRAARGDCRTKHAQMGLLAIPFLVTDTVKDTGCKW
jgi:hypothetical protein